MPELKPCPFCGGEAEIKCNSYGTQKNEEIDRFARYFSIRCTKCRCELPRQFQVTFDYSLDTGVRANESDLLKGIEAWNRRVNNG